VVLYTDDTCPSSLQNQENVVYIVQAANKGIITLDFKQNGDYYISSSVRRRYSQLFYSEVFVEAIGSITTDSNERFLLGASKLDKYAGATELCTVMSMQQLQNC
jgi:hypothetical protein